MSFLQKAKQTSMHIDFTPNADKAEIEQTVLLQHPPAAGFVVQDMHFIST